MIGFKGTNNGKCLHLQYEVGKTYELVEGKLRICKTGFHFCERFDNVDIYYPFSDKNTVIYEIEALGKIINEGDKSVTDKIRIIREIPKSEYSKFFDNRFEYDEDGNMIKFEDPYGYWRKYKYDEDGNIIKFKDSGGYLEKYGYDKNGNRIKFENLGGFWEKYEYDKKGKRIKSEDSNGYWKKYEYDKNGNRIKFKDSNGYWKKHEYDKNGNLIKFEDSDGYWVKYKYENCSMIGYETSNDKCILEEVRIY